MSQSVSGEAAFAYGTINSGVQLITGYPGSPSSGAFELLLSLKPTYEYSMEWSLNEKVACEVAIGGSIGGLRSLICTKSVGLNVMIDPLMALNLTPLNAGLVILLGDDPQGYGSQNDQDSRAIVHLLEMPLWEPADPVQAYAMMPKAFEISEKFGVPVILRETRSFSQHEIDLDIKLNYEVKKRTLIEEPFRFVPVPKNAVAKHLALQESLSAIESFHENCSFNEILGSGSFGIIASGFTVQKLMDVLGDEMNQFRIMKLTTLFPLPVNKICEFLESCDEVMILEESSEFIERGIKVIAWENNSECKISGKKDLGLNAAGELFRWQISKILAEKFPATKIKPFRKEDETSEYPKLKNNCKESRYEEVIGLVEEAGKKLGVKPLMTGDPGCIFIAGEKLIAKYAIGSAVGLASGLFYSGVNRPVVAFVGDSGFFHTTLPAIANATFTQSNFVIIILDNGGALTTGLQPTPAVGINTIGQKSEPLDFRKISESLGIRDITEVSLNESREKITDVFAKGLIKENINVILVKIPANE